MVGTPVCDPGLIAVLGPSWCPHLGGMSRLRLGRVRTVVVAGAHLDEELCAAGGLLSSLAASGARVRVLAVTDGDGACDVDPSGATRLRSRRARLSRAYQLLGLNLSMRYRLGLRCGTLERGEADVLAALSELLGFADPTGLLCLAPWIYDTHSDHAAVGRAATLACQAYRARLLYYSVTGWHHPDRLGSPEIPLARSRRFQLPEVLDTRKYQALEHLTRPHRAPTPASLGAAPNPLSRACEVFITSGRGEPGHPG
jgi:LmbE family N-acetylglucosaminyl deacetylase